MSEQRDSVTIAHLRELFDAGVVDVGIAIWPILTAYDDLRAQLAAAERELDDWRNREAAVCPEDVGFDELISLLRARAGGEGCSVCGSVIAQVGSTVCEAHTTIGGPQSTEATP